MRSTQIFALALTMIGSSIAGSAAFNAYESFDCSGPPIITDGQNSPGTSKCFGIEGTHSAQVFGSGCTTFFFSDVNCSVDRFPGDVPNSNCYTGVQSVQIAC